MQLGSRTPEHLLRPASDTDVRRNIEVVLQKFRLVFTSISYDVLWQSRTWNAQAFVTDGLRCVRLYGGLARHVKVTQGAIAWVLAHETGHHLGGPPQHPDFSWISSEERANAWAREIGLPRIFGETIARNYSTIGKATLEGLTPSDVHLVP